MTELDDDDENVSLKSSDVHSVLGGVSIPWLMKAFRMGRQRIEQCLRGVTPVAQGKHNTPLYDLIDAASCLVTPKIDIAEFIKNMGPDALPEKMRDGYWAGRLRQQTWERNAGDLWRTRTIVEKLGEVLLAMRVKLQLMPEMIERQHGLSSEQRTSLVAIVDEVQGEMYQVILDFTKNSKTYNQLGSEEPLSERNDEDIV